MARLAVTDGERERAREGLHRLLAEEDSLARSRRSRCGISSGFAVTKEDG